MADGSPSQSQLQRPGSSRARKRVKVTRACDTCKSRKKACTGDIPCQFCVRSNLRCSYKVPYHRGSATTPLPSAPGGNVPRLASTPSIPTSAMSASTPDPESVVGAQYRGPASAHSFLDRAVRNFRGTQRALNSASEDAHASIFSHGDRHAPPIPESQIQWPSRAAVDWLVRRYFDFSSPTYRVLHQGTVEGWVNTLFGQEVRTASGPNPGPSPAVRAIVLMMCAIASSFSDMHDMPAEHVARNTLQGQQSETYYQMADQLLVQEQGSPSLESVQARFLTVLYLLGTSRMNRAWFNFGSAVQLLMALGLHRKQTHSRAIASLASTKVAIECSKRVLWCSFTLDEYLSLILGRPRLLREEDIDQDYPTLVNDEQIDAHPPRSRLQRNCLMDAPVCHAKLARILAKASQDLYSIQPFEKEQEVVLINSLVERITQWQSELPPLLGDWVCPSSLISIFQRQLTVIRLARFHALMFVTRPLLLRDYCQESEQGDDSIRLHLRSCVNTARATLELVLDLVKDNLLYPAFWFTQYIAFNALSIVYIYLIHSKKGRIPHAWLFGNDLPSSTVSPDLLYKLAEETQYHLGQATERNALAWRYNIVLEALRLEATGQISETSNDGDETMNRTQQDLGHHPSSQLVGANDNPPFEHGLPAEQSLVDWDSFQAPITYDAGIGTMFNFADDLCLDFWPQLDRLPTCKFIRYVR
ncbi:hypothetical protein N7532_010253 [Penicillium argentinense]|uniref:Zn(2)-C6 fungal-type domain-containing protein n=1 Tax=Penicillium argentinense TaxID=1131581 RepID=A0A9W9EP91_9EURO|nr:uncharacterized protein N7532_010253 [Penicillium argentinense]KAJ5085482.1 hypothetical protein N7532_010253 [Penicillium argentinense]